METETTVVENVIDALLRKTEAALLDWEPAGHPNSFAFAGESGTVVVESRDRDGVAPFQLRILDDGGVETDRFLDRDSSTSLPKLFHLVSRRTRGGTPVSPILAALALELAAV